MPCGDEGRDADRRLRVFLGMSCLQGPPQAQGRQLLRVLQLWRRALPSHTGEPGLLQLTALELKVPPVVVVAVAAGAMWLAAWLLPALHWPFPGNVAAALILGAAGVAASIAGVVEFRRARTTVNPL
jgi:hypothetical protein